MWYSTNMKKYILLFLIVPLIFGFAILRPGKGLAQAVDNPQDRINLGVSWYFVWGWCNESFSCVPMVRSMQLPPECPNQLLVGNEPNAIEPYGSPVSPNDAVNSVITIQRKCPNTKLVVGNVSVDDWSVAKGWGSGYNWLKNFWAGYYWATGHNYTGAFGIHCYSYQAQYCIDKLSEIDKWTRNELWITEFNILDGNTIEFTKLLKYITRNYKTYAVYTNRQPIATDCGWCISSGVELVDHNGNLTPTGQIYANW